jgi:hypothetical protein
MAAMGATAPRSRTPARRTRLRRPRSLTATTCPCRGPPGPARSRRARSPPVRPRRRSSCRSRPRWAATPHAQVLQATRERWTIATRIFLERSPPRSGSRAFPDQGARAHHAGRHGRDHQGRSHLVGRHADRRRRRSPGADLRRQGDLRDHPHTRGPHAVFGRPEARGRRRGAARTGPRTAARPAGRGGAGGARRAEAGAHRGPARARVRSRRRGHARPPRREPTGSRSGRRSRSTAISRTARACRSAAIASR